MSSQEQEKQLLQKYEPVIRFNKGERFFPISVTDYVPRTSLWVQRPNEEPRRLISESRLTLEKLSNLPSQGQDAIHFLKFIEPIKGTQFAAYRIKEGLVSKEFSPGFGRLARVGYSARFIDALFSLTLFARGRVPGLPWWRRRLRQRFGTSTLHLCVWMRCLNPAISTA